MTPPACPPTSTQKGAEYALIVLQDHGAVQGPSAAVESPTGPGISMVLGDSPSPVSGASSDIPGSNKKYGITGVAKRRSLSGKDGVQIMVPPKLMSFPKAKSAHVPVMPQPELRSEISVGKQVAQEQTTLAYQGMQQTLFAVPSEAAKLADSGTPVAVSPTEPGDTGSMPIVAQIVTPVEAAVLIVDADAPCPVTDLASTELRSSKPELKPIIGQKRKSTAKARFPDKKPTPRRNYADMVKTLEIQLQILKHEKQDAERMRDNQTERAKGLLYQKNCLARNISKLRDENSQLKTAHAQEIAAICAAHAQQCNALK